ncbi:MAG: HU family DNA-binding protein [Hyphomonadaceae bacterium]
MNKAEFVADVSERIGESKQRGEEVVNAVFESLTNALRRGDEVRLPQFGVFLVSQTKERKARNPQTGEEVVVPAGKRPKFRAGKALKEAIG